MKIKQLRLITSLAFLLIVFTSFKPQNIKVVSEFNDECGQWQKDASSEFQFRTCHFTDDVNFRTFQVYNPYDVEVHVFVHLSYANGTEATYGIYIDPNHESDKLTTNHRGISNWQITKKQKKDSNDKWKDF